MALTVPSRRERKKQLTKERLLAAAWDLYRSKGFDATTVEEITNTADVAKGTFFNYFASKEEMLPPLAAWRMSKLSDRIDVAQGAPASPLARIRLLLQGLAEDIFPDRDLARRMFSTLICRRADPEKPPLPLRQALNDLVCEAQATGEIRSDVDARLVARLLMTGSLPDAWHRSSGSEAAAETANIEHIIEILLDGLADKKMERIV